VSCADFISRRVALRQTGLAALALTLHGCSSTSPGQGKAESNADKSAARGKPSSTSSSLPAPSASRDWRQYRLQAARRLVAANPGQTYLSAPPDILLAIPVLEVELNGDGSIKRINVMRYPGQARDTVGIAMDAIKRAAPFGDVSHLPKPWKFVETFLFNNERHFKPRTLDT
jgi:hypothetical protein